MEDNTNIHVVNLASYEYPEIIEDNREDWVSFGADNNYYEWLIDRYKNSTTNNAVINNISRLIYGRGLHALDANKRVNDYAQMKALFSPKTLKAVAKNLKMLGSGVFQVLYNDKHTKIIGVEAVKTKLIRCGKCNKDGDITHYYYSDNWQDVKNYPPQRIAAFGTSKDSIELLIIQEESIDMKYYPDVDYFGALPYCVLEEEISDYLINDVQNGFSGTKVVNFNNGVPTEEQQRLITNKVNRKLTGSKGLKTIVAFNQNQESKTTVDDIPLNDAPEHYQYLSTEAQSKILNGHTVISPMLVGVTIENNGFSSNADEIETASKFFHNVAVKPFQDAIIDAVNEVLAFNGVSLDLYFRRLNLLDSVEEVEQVKESVAFTSQLQGYLEGIGEDMEQEGWELIDEREVDYDLEDDLDSQVKEWENSLKEPQSLIGKLSKGVANLVGTGRANPNVPSEQDKEIDGFYFKVRYTYVGDEAPERDFCKAMMRANKVYKKEDIIKMGKQPVNKGFGEGGAETYSIWLYKGGPRCEHKWKRRTYVSANKTASIGSAKTSEVSTGKARKFGYRVTNEKEVAMIPKHMPHKGFSPNNPNIPKDAR